VLVIFFNEEEKTERCNWYDDFGVIVSIGSKQG